MARELLFLHLRCSTARYLWWVVPLSLAVVAPGALTHNLRLWGELPSAIGYTVVLLGPVAAGVVAWEAARERVEGTAEVLAPMPTDSAARLGARALAAVLILGIAYLASSLVIAGWYLVAGARGPVGWGPVALGAVGLLTWAAFGALAGSVWPWRWTPAAVVIGVYFGQAFLSAYWPGLMPFEDGGSALVPYSTRLAAMRGFLWVLVAVALGCVTAALHRRRQRRPVRRAVAVAVLAAALCLPVGSAVASHKPPTPQVVPTACAGAEPKVCVDPTFEPIVGPLALAMKRAFAPLTDAGVAPRLILHGLVPSIGATSMTMPLYSINDRIDVDVLAHDAAQNWIVRSACWDDNTDISVPEGVLRWTLGAAAADVDLGGPRAAQVQRSLERLQVQARTAWLRRHWDDMVECRQVALP